MFRVYVRAYTQTREEAEALLIALEDQVNKLNADLDEGDIDEEMED
jgi:hypothetical protein